MSVTELWWEREREIERGEQRKGDNAANYNTGQARQQRKLIFADFDSRIIRTYMPVGDWMLWHVKHSINNTHTHTYVCMYLHKLSMYYVSNVYVERNTNLPCGCNMLDVSKTTTAKPTTSLGQCDVTKRDGSSFSTATTTQHKCQANRNATTNKTHSQLAGAKEKEGAGKSMELLSRSLLPKQREREWERDSEREGEREKESGKLRENVALLTSLSSSSAI